MKSYVGDMIVNSKQVPDHFGDLRECFETLRKNTVRLNPSKYTFRFKAEKFLGYMVRQRLIEVNPEKIKATMDIESPRIF